MKNELNPQQYDYDPPVAHLLTVGDARDLRDWPDYPATYDLTHDHVPDLVRMMHDEGLNWADTESDEVWAPVHAWRALGQLRAASAVDDILAALSVIDEYPLDWQTEELPKVLGMIGPSALPAVKTYLSDGERGLWSRVAVTRAIVEIGRRHPSARERCIDLLIGRLSRHARQDPTINAYLISALIDLKPIDDVTPIKEAFDAGDVDLTVQGDWEETQVHLGLRSHRRTPKSKPSLAQFVERLQKARAKAVAAAEESERWEEVGRNDPCPCGSGKKYKRRHGKPGRK